MVIPRQRTTCKSFLQKHILKVYQGIILDHRIKDSKGECCFCYWYMIIFQCAICCNEWWRAANNTLFDNSGTLDFIRWDERSHVLYFSEAATFIWFYTESRIHVEFHPFLKIFHIWLTLTVKMCSIDLLLDDALLGRLHISIQWSSTLPYAFWKSINTVLCLLPIPDCVPSSLSKLLIAPCMTMEFSMFSGRATLFSDSMFHVGRHKSILLSSS